MSTKNNETVIEMQTTSKEKWEQPELIELDLNETESSLLPGSEGALTVS